MSFTQGTFAPIGPTTTNTPTYYSYRSDDITSTVLTAGYFAIKQQQLKENDIIFSVLGDQIRQFTVTGDTSTVEVSSYLNEETVEIRKEADFPAVVNGVHPLEAREYVIIGTVTVAFPLEPPKDQVCTFRGANFLGAFFNFTGSGALFKNDDFGFGILDLIEITIGCTVGQIFDITGGAGSAIIGHQVAYVGVNDMGFSKGTLFVILISNVFDFGQGIVLEDNTGIVLSEISWLGGRNEVSTFVTIKGTQENIEIAQDFMNTAGANETILDIESDVTTLGAIVSGVSFDISSGGTIFAPGSLDQRSLNWRYSGCAGVPDSTVKGVLKFEENALVTTMPGSANTPTRINAVWSDGQIEERIVFRDKITFDNTTDTVTSVDGLVDATGGTAFINNQTNGDVIKLVANGGLPSELSSISYFVGNATATGFQLFSDSGLTMLVTFSDDGIEPNYYDHQQGDSASGWFCYTGRDSVSVAVLGWVSIKKNSGGESPVRAVIMKTDTSFNVTRERNGSKESARNTLTGSSSIAHILDLETAEGFIPYVENLVGTIDNDITDADIIALLA